MALSDRRRAHDRVGHADLLRRRVSVPTTIRMRTITDLIARLEAIREQRGNVRVKIWDDYDGCYIERISL